MILREPYEGNRLIGTPPQNGSMIQYFGETLGQTRFNCFFCCRVSQSLYYANVGQGYLIS